MCIVDDNIITMETISLTHKIDCTGFLFREKEKYRGIDKEKLPKRILPKHIAQLKEYKDIFDTNDVLPYKNKGHTLPLHTFYIYAYCSETSYNENIISQIAGVDLLYHERTFSNKDSNKAHKTLHSTASEAAAIAHKAHVKKLMVGRFSPDIRILRYYLVAPKLIFPAPDLLLKVKPLILVRYDPRVNKKEK